MIPQIFDIVSGNVVINENCLLIPEFKAVVKAYKDPLPAFTFLHYLHSPDGPYCNIPEDDKEDVVSMDFPGEYSLEDEVMIVAMAKMKSFFTTPTYRYYQDQKYLLEKLGKFARTTPITAGKDGNINAFSAQIRSTTKTINEFKALESIVLKELSNARKVRGGKKLAYDG